LVRPIIRRFGEQFAGVLETIMSTARTVFNYLRQHITRRVRQASVIFQTLADRWEAAKAVLRAGFRVIAAEVNRWLVVPFVRLQGTLVGMADLVRMAFLRVKLGVMEMMASIVTGFRDLLRGLGPIGSSIAAALDPVTESIQERVARIGGTVAQRRAGQYGGEIGRAASEIRAERERRQSVIDEANARSEAARQEADRAEQERRRVEAETRRRVAVAGRDPTREPVTEGPRRGRPVVEPEAPRPTAPAAPRAGEVEESAEVVSRRRGTEEERRARETAEMAEAMAISEFSRTAREQMTAAMRAAMPGPGRPGRPRRARPAPPPTPR